MTFLLIVKCVYLCVLVNLLGPGVGGDYGPYRQSERNSLYKQHAENLHQSGHVYRCFCSNEVCLELASCECDALDSMIFVTFDDLACLHVFGRILVVHFVCVCVLWKRGLFNLKLFRRFYDNCVNFSKQFSTFCHRIAFFEA